MRRGGLNGLLVALLTLTVAAAVVGATVRVHRLGVALDSSVVNRVETGVVVWLVGYLVIGGVWLGWQRRLFNRRASGRR